MALKIFDQKLSKVSLHKFIIVWICSALLGCQNMYQYHQTTMCHIQDQIKEGLCEDEMIANAHRGMRITPCGMPAEVTAMMVPNMLGRGVPLSPLERRYDIIAEQVPARSFFLSLVKDTPYNMILPPNLDGKISIQLKKVTIPQILSAVRNVYGYDFRRAPNGFEILAITLQTRAYKVNYLNMDRSGESEIRISAGALSSSTSGATTAGGAGAAPGTTSTTSGAGEIQITNSRIRTTSKTDFWIELKQAVENMVGGGEGRRVAISPMSGLIVVQAFPAELRKVEDFLRKSELTINRQVTLEAKILEVQLNDSYQAGINWALISGRMRATEFGGEVAGQSPIIGVEDFPELTTNYATSVIPVEPGRTGPNRSIAPAFDSGQNVGAFGGVFTLAFNYKNLGAFIELLGGQGKVQVLSNPRISTMNNQKALIKVGTDQFFITNISTTTTAIGTTAQTTPNVTFDPFFSGIAMDITPSIDECDDMTLHIHPIVSNVQDQVKNFTLNGVAQSIPLAATTVRETDTMVRARSGQMVVIGGLMQDNLGRIREGVPFLMDLPVIGNLFSHVSEKLKKSELVILIRPVSVAEDCVWPGAIEESLDNFKNLMRGCEG